MLDPAPGHLLSQSLEIKPEALSQRCCHHWKDVATVTLQPWALPLPSCLLTSCLSVPKGITGPTLAYSLSPGSREGVFLWEGRGMRGACQPRCPKAGWGCPEKRLAPSSHASLYATGGQEQTLDLALPTYIKLLWRLGG